MNELKNVVLTGLGAITAQGDRTMTGKSTLPAKKSAGFSIAEFSLGDYLGTHKTYLDRCSALALAAGALALKDAEIETPVSNEKFGITLGTHFGCIETMEQFWGKVTEKGARLANPLLFSHSYFNTPISLCAIEFGLKGYHGTFCAQEHSGSEAVRAASDAIRLGHAEAMLCGGVDALSPARALFTPQQNASEAAVFFILESEEHAQVRSAKNIRTLDETWCERLGNLEEIRGQFGDCGGALSTLALAQSLALL